MRERIDDEYGLDVPALFIEGASGVRTVRPRMDHGYELSSRCLINPGSVGQPRDGDPRASYALIEDGEVTLKRAAYDVERTVRGLKWLPLDQAIVDELAAILRHGKAG